jgi:general secretion pathway protein A
MSFGIPRLINVICDRALLGAYVQGKDTVDKKTLVKAAQEVFGERDIYKRPRKALTWVLTCIVLVICGVAVASTYYNYKSTVKASGILGPKVSTSEIRKSDNLQWPVSRQVAKREIDDSLFYGEFQNL